MIFSKEITRMQPNRQQSERQSQQRRPEGERREETRAGLLPSPLSLPGSLYTSTGGDVAPRLRPVVVANW